MINTEQMIADLMHSSFGEELGAREKYLFREALYSLVRLAKAEQMLEIKTNVHKLTGMPMPMSDLSPVDTQLGQAQIYIAIQQQFEFHDPE